jgi:hypothetical protein
MRSARIIISFFVALFIALMVGVVVPAVFPDAAKLATPLLCSSSEQMMVTSETFNPEPGRTITSNSWFCAAEDGTQRALDILPLLVCGFYAFIPAFILMLIFIKPVPATPTTSVAVGAGLSASGQGTSAPETSRSLDVRLAELTRARDAGLITEEEFQKKKQDMLSAL